MNHRYLLLALISIVALSSCVVSKKKYDDLNARKSSLEVQKAECDSAVVALADDTTALGKDIRKLLKQQESLIVDTAKLGFMLRNKINAYDELYSSANKDAKKLSQLIERSGELNQKLEASQLELDKKNALLKEDQAKIATLQGDLQKREKRVTELESIIAQQEEAVNKLKDKISSALLSFDDDELTVELRNGKVYVSLAEQLLFKSGSYDVDPKGISAIDKLANAIKGNKDIDIIVEGHTDDVPMKGSGPIADNWDLSVKRATSIVKVLVKSGVDPKKVTASGKAEFSPKVPEKTAEARSKNRRTEIVISPNLDELFQLLEAAKN